MSARITQPSSTLGVFNDGDSVAVDDQSGIALWQCICDAVFEQLLRAVVEQVEDCEPGGRYNTAVAEL